MPSVKEFKEHPRNANTDWQRLGRTFNVSSFSPQTLNKTDCLIGNSYWKNTWSSCVENYSLNVYSKVPTASHLKMPCCAAIKYLIKDTKEAWWNGYTFYQYVKLLSCLENLMLSNKNTSVYQLSCGVDLDATLEKSEIKIDQKMYAQPTMVVVLGRAEIKYEYTYLWVLTFINAQCVSISLPLICIFKTVCVILLALLIL